MDFRAPIDDILFTLKAGVDDPAAVDLDMAEAILTHFATFAEDVLAPLNRPGDRQGCRLDGDRVRLPAGFADAYRAYAEQGWPGLAIPEAYGGQGMSEHIAAAVSEILAGANHAFQMMVGVVPAAARTLIAHGDERLTRTWLPRLASGAWLATMCLSEPEAGSDLSAIRTRGEWRDGRWLINGEKIFISGGDQDMSEGILHLVLARTGDPGSGIAGLSLFVCPSITEDGARNGVRVTRLEHKLGLAASPTCTLSFEDAAAELIGGEGEGLKCMFGVMNPMRLDVALQGVAHAAAAAALSRAYAAERVQGRGPGSADRVPIAAHGDVQRMLMTQDALALGGRAMAYHALSLLAGAPLLADFLTPVCKVFCSDAAFEAADLAVQVLGGYGYLTDYSAEQSLRDARITRIYEGTNGIHAMTLARRSLRLGGGEAVAAFDRAVSDARGKDAALVDAWREATQAVLALDDPGMVAMPYMKLTGLVAFAAAWRRLEAHAAMARDPDRIRGLADFVKKALLPAGAMWAAQCRDPRRHSEQAQK